DISRVAGLSPRSPGVPFNTGASLHSAPATQPCSAHFHLLEPLVNWLHERLGNVHQQPAEGGQYKEQSEDTKQQVSAQHMKSAQVNWLLQVQQYAGDGGHTSGRQVADHVHGAPDGAGVALANIGASRPGRSHVDVVTEKRETKQYSKEINIVHPNGGKYSQAGQGESDAAIETAAPLAIA